MSRQPRTSGELVPLTHRVRYLQGLRLSSATLVAVFALFAPGALGEALRGLLALTGGYLLMTLVAEAFWRRSRQRGLGLFSLMLVVDGLFLWWVSFDTGGLTSPFRYLCLLHVGAVALLASYRTGLKLALWHSLLLIVGYHAAAAGLLVASVGSAASQPGSDFTAMVAFVAAFWLIAIATALFSAVNERELRRRRYDLEALAKMAGELELSQQPFAVANVLLDNLLEAFGYQRGVVLSALHGGFEVLAVRGGAGEASPAPVGSDGLLDRALSSRTTLLVPGLHAKSDQVLAALLPDARNLVVVRLTADGGTIGVVVLEHSGSKIERRVVTMTERFVAHAALALSNARLLERLHAMATTDDLTGLANRRTFQATLPRELSRAIRVGEPVSLVMLDIDHFKRINDSYGHKIGDDVLRAVSGVLAARCRDFDTLARYGGEEFGIILPGTGPGEAVAIAERLCEAVRSVHTPVAVSVSAGAATYPLHTTDAEDLVLRADEALYTSKRKGRDRVTLCTMVEDDPGPSGGARQPGSAAA